MVKFLLVLLVFSTLLSCHRGKHADRAPHGDTTLRILTYGLPDLDYGRARNVVAKKYGFSYFAVTGCVITKPLMDSINQENSFVYEQLAARFGKGWKKSFEKEVDTLQRQQRSAEALVKEQPFIKTREKELKKDTAALDYFITPTGRAGEFTVEAYTWQQRGQQSVPVTCFNLLVNLSKKSVTRL